MFGPLSNNDIETYFRGDKKFGGVFAKDKIPQKFKTNHYYVFNLDDSIGAGTHWTAIYCNNDKIDYFDSFGVVPPQNIMRSITKTTKPAFYNSFHIQHIDSAMCGYYCIYFIEQMKKGHKHMDIVFKFGKDKHMNDKTMENYFT